MSNLSLLRGMLASIDNVDGKGAEVPESQGPALRCIAEDGPAALGSVCSTGWAPSLQTARDDDSVPTLNESDLLRLEERTFQASQVTSVFVLPSNELEQVSARRFGPSEHLLSTGVDASKNRAG